MASSALWRSAPPNGGHPSSPTSKLGCRSSRPTTQRWHHMQQNLAAMPFTSPYSRTQVLLRRTYIIQRKIFSWESDKFSHATADPMGTYLSLHAFGRDASCSRPSRFKVWAQESSPLNTSTSIEGFSSEAVERESSSKSGEVTDQNLLLKLLILAIAVAALFTVFAALQFQSSSTLVGTKPAEAGPHYKLRLLGKDMLIGERCPGWIYFWLLMAAGFGLFVSEEALNVWVGATLARTLTFNGLWMDLVTSVSANGFYLFSTVFWVYWGVCISDMIPFYAGRFAAQTKAGDTLRKKVGVSEKKLESISQTVQRYGNLIGFVERFSLGVRNPTSFVAGAMGVSPEKFFTGVCLGGLITMPLQMGVGFVLRERPMAALAGVAAAVGAWTVLPYVAAGITSIVFIIRTRAAQQHPSTATCSKDRSN